MPFGQIVIGPPGSGKTTYCNGISQFLTSLGRRVAIINLDPANESLPYQPAVDIGDLVGLEEVQEEIHLGPNGAMIYCMDYLWKNMDWLVDKLEPLQKDGFYFLFDCPGQVELFTLHDSLKLTITNLVDKLAHRLVVVHLVDSHLCCAPNKYISALLLSLSSMLHLELPHVNVLSKMDLVKLYGDLKFRLDYFLKAQDLSRLVQQLGEESAYLRSYKQMSQALCEVVEEFGLVGFIPLAIEDKESVQSLIGIVDKANGFVFVDESKISSISKTEDGQSAISASSMELWESLQDKNLDATVREHSGDE